MFRALKQFVILVAFLLLSVFAALYFQEDREGVAQQTENDTAIWLINAVKKTGGILSSVANLSLAINPKLDFSENEQFDNWEEVGSYDFNNSEALAEGKVLMEGFSQKAEQSEFREFFNDFLSNIPTLYLDAKIYSNAWRNIRSLEWLRPEL
jgi:hypothetical protein